MTVSGTRALKMGAYRGTWVAQSVECMTLAQVMISQSVGLSLVLGSVLTAQSLEPISDSVSLSGSLSQIGRAHV